MKYRAIFTDRQGVRYDLGGVSLEDIAELYLNASMVEPFTVTEEER